MVMFSESIKGINYGLHSNGIDVLRCILDKLPPTSDGHNEPAEIAHGVVTNLIHSTTPETFPPVLDTIKEYVDTRSEGSQNPNIPECSRLIFACVATRKGLRIKNWKPVHQVLVALLKQVSASPEKYTETVPQLLKVVAYALQLSPMDEMLPFMRTLMDLVSTGPSVKVLFVLLHNFLRVGSGAFPQPDASLLPEVHQLILEGA